MRRRLDPSRAASATACLELRRLGDRARACSARFAVGRGHDEAGRMRELVARLVVAVGKADRRGDLATSSGAPVKKRMPAAAARVGEAARVHRLRRGGVARSVARVDADRDQVRRAAGREARGRDATRPCRSSTRLQRFWQRRYSSTSNVGRPSSALPSVSARPDSSIKRASAGSCAPGCWRKRELLEGAGSTAMRRRRQDQEPER